MKKLKPFASIILLMIIWHVLTLLKIIDVQFFPSPFVFGKKLFVLLMRPDFLHDCLRSIYRLAAGFFIALPVSFFAAVLCSHNLFFDRLISPLIAFTYPLPKVAIFPLLLLIFGIGDGAKIAIITLGIFYLLFIQLRIGMLKLRHSRVGELVRVYHVEGFNYYYHVLLKGIYLDFLTGLKTSLGYGLTLVVVSEFSMSRDGIGNFIWKAWDQFNVVDMYAGILFLCLLGFFIYSGIDFLIRKNQITRPSISGLS